MREYKLVIPARFERDNSFYDFPAFYHRFHLEAPVRFESSIRCGIEHGGVNDTDSKIARPDEDERADGRNDRITQITK